VYACQYWAAILYQKAALIAADKKLIAENLYAQATALRRQSYNEDLDNSQNHIEYSYKNAIHKLLENYQDTEILDSLLGKCPLLRDYQVQ
jgi:acyl-CoA reductase-like NAD-dependent aldehyde dehydrogenase